MILIGNFLWCLTLKTGVLVIAWSNLAFDAFVGFGCVYALILSSYDCSDLPKFLGDFQKACLEKHGVSSALFITVATIASALILISWRCIKGVNDNNPAKLKPMMIVIAVSLFFGALKLLSFTPRGVICAIIEILLYGYEMLVLHSYVQSNKQRQNIEEKYSPPVNKSEAFNDSESIINSSSDTPDHIELRSDNFVPRPLPNNSVPSSSSTPSYIS